MKTISPKQLEQKREASRRYRATPKGKQRERDYYKAHREKRIAYSKEYKRAWSQTCRGRASRLIDSARQRAKASGLVCTLALSDITRRLETGLCEATCLRLDLTSKGRVKHSGPRAPSLDRCDPFEGYTPLNTLLVCNQYNRAKHEWDHATLVELAAALVRAERGKSIQQS